MVGMTVVCDNRFAQLLVLFYEDFFKKHNIMNSERSAYKAQPTGDMCIAMQLMIIAKNASEPIFVLFIPTMTHVPCRVVNHHKTKAYYKLAAVFLTPVSWQSKSSREEPI